MDAEMSAAIEAGVRARGCTCQPITYDYAEGDPPAGILGIYVRHRSNCPLNPDQSKERSNGQDGT